MDVKRLHKAATDALTGDGVNTEMAYAMQALQLFTNPDALTLDAAVQVMGREPISAAGEHWNCGDDIWLMKRITENHVAMVEIGDNKWWHPTIGQFACLVAAARMGEKA